MNEYERAVWSWQRRQQLVAAGYRELERWWEAGVLVIFAERHGQERRFRFESPAPIDAGTRLLGVADGD